MSAREAERCLVRGCKEKGLLPISRDSDIGFALCQKHYVSYREKVMSAEMRIAESMKMDFMHYWASWWATVPAQDKLEMIELVGMKQANGK